MSLYFIENEIPHSEHSEESTYFANRMMSLVRKGGIS